MIIICAADFHGKKERYEHFIRGIEKEKPDICVIAGDMGYIDESIFNKIDLPFYAVHGNTDSNLKYEKINFIDGKNLKINSLKFSGIGKLFPEIEGVDIIISHFPPYKTKDKAFFGMHIGDKKLRKIMEEKKPSYIICGHVHEDAGYDKFCDTIVVNCSVGKSGEYTIIDTDKGKIVMVGYDV
ncbi:MAG: metallophosphoesterase family protein [Thermoplasmatales archaeon]|nr:metallophosphoesterase family protein [Thermoplasmatales archaeon]